VFLIIQPLVALFGLCFKTNTLGFAGKKSITTPKFKFNPTLGSPYHNL
jgi:hypothetical protein